jgi:hypothetical protein
MTPPRAPCSRHDRYGVRHQARLDAEMHATLEALAHSFYTKRAQILRHVMQWGLAHTNRWTADRSIPASAHPVTLLVGPELYQQVQDAADAQGADLAALERHAMRQVSGEDFPASWHAADVHGDEPWS